MSRLLKIPSWDLADTWADLRLRCLNTAEIGFQITRPYLKLCVITSKARSNCFRFLFTFGQRKEIVVSLI